MMDREGGDVVMCERTQEVGGGGKLFLHIVML